MDGTILPLSVETVTRIYLEGLSQGKSLNKQPLVTARNMPQACAKPAKARGIDARVWSLKGSAAFSFLP
jgi:hypothetical protein